MTVKFYLKHKAKKEKTADEVQSRQPEKPAQVYARICYKEATPFKYYPDFEKIKPSDWNPNTQRARKSLRTSSIFNERINDVEARISKVFQAYKAKHDKAPNMLKFKSLLDKEFNRERNTNERERGLKTFWGYFEDMIARSEAGTRVHRQTGKPLAPGTVANMKILQLHLRKFEAAKRWPLDFDNIDLKFLHAFLDYSTRQGVVQRIKKNGKKTAGGGHAATTTAKLITGLKVVLREAHEDGYSSNTFYSHRRFTYSPVQPETIYLTEQEISDIQALDLSKNKRLERVRDLFVIQCHTGVRFTDLAKIQMSDTNRDVFLVMQTKTGTPGSIPAKMQVIEILGKYNGKAPAVVSNVKFNKYIKEVCSMVESMQKEVKISTVKAGRRDSETVAKYKLVSSHTARRSFATNEYNRSELTVREIMCATGHGTEKAFFRYIRTTPQEHAENAVRKIRAREAKEIAMLSPLRVVSNQ